MMFENAVTPPQIVPYDAYDNFPENFDLSILASDNPYANVTFGTANTVPVMATQQQQQAALPIINTTTNVDAFGQPAADQASKMIPTIKIENSWDSPPYTASHQTVILNNNNGNYSNQLQVTVPQYGNNLYSYPSPQSCNSAMSYENQFGAFPPSPTPSVNNGDFTQSAAYAGNPICSQSQFTQETGSGNLLLPPSPPDSNGAPSPSAHFYMDQQVKLEPQDQYQMTENSVPLEDCVDIEEYFRGIRSENMFRPIDSAPSVDGGESKGDHQLLRECLQDTSFQRRHNLKPVALESLLGGWESRGDIEPVISLAIEQARRDVEDTCALLNISPDPQQWSNAVVQLWLQTMIEQLNLTSLDTPIGVAFPESGLEFYNLSEKEFLQKAPQIGSTLFAQLEIWKTACIDVSFNLDSNNGGQLSPNSSTASLDTEPSDDEEEMEKPEPVVGQKRHAGSHIHLWQFLKELLAAPQTHGAAIRWLDRSKGVFKIEDSVIVARLWGRRKNRPAMNYDKLSRSIRQYYKKGIMKKTERSQRLVYQFCHPYCL